MVTLAERLEGGEAERVRVKDVETVTLAQRMLLLAVDLDPRVVLATPRDMRGQTNDVERDRRARLQERFRQEFADTGVELPEPAAVYGRPGWIRRSGWRVSFVWGDDSQYLEYEASWGLAGDQIHRRMWADGRTEELDAINEFAVAAIEADVAAAIDETGSYNRGIEPALTARGLFPSPHISLQHEAWSERDLWSGLELTPNALRAIASEKAASMIDSALPEPWFLESNIEIALLAAIGDLADPRSAWRPQARVRHPWLDRRPQRHRPLHPLSLASSALPTVHCRYPARRS